MVLYRINDFDPDYRRRLGAQAVVGYQLYNGDRNLGSVDDLLVDASGQYRYLVIHPGGWLFGKQVLLPIGQAWIDTSTRQVFVSGLTREQVKALPAFTATTIIDAAYEAQVSHVYQRRQQHPSGLPLLEEHGGLEQTSS